MIEHECLVCGALMTDGWDICVNCLADTFGRPTDPIRDQHNTERRKWYEYQGTTDDGDDWEE